MSHSFMIAGDEIVKRFRWQHRLSMARLHDNSTKQMLRGT
jgi:hypothetical protein